MYISIDNLNTIKYNYDMLQNEFLYKKLKAEIKTSVSIKILTKVLLPYTVKYDFKVEELINDFIEHEKLVVVKNRIINFRSVAFLRKLYFYARQKNKNYSIKESQLKSFAQKFFKIEITDDMMKTIHGILLYELAGICHYENGTYQMNSIEELKYFYIKNQIEKKHFIYLKKIVRTTRYD